MGDAICGTHKGSTLFCLNTCEILIRSDGATPEDDESRREPTVHLYNCLAISYRGV